MLRKSMVIGKNKVKYGLNKLQDVRGKMTFGRLLIAYRASQNLSQIELAKKLQLSKGNICDLKKGRKIPTASKASEIAKTLSELPQYWVEVAIQNMPAQKLDYVVKN